MPMVTESARPLKSYIGQVALSDLAKLMAMRMCLGFMFHRGRMSCAEAAGMIGSEVIHRGQLTTFLARRRWQKCDFNEELRSQLLSKVRTRGRYIFIIDATLCSQSGKKTENSYSTGNRKRRPCKGRRYGKQVHIRKKCHYFTFGLLITPDGTRIPFQRPHYTKEYCETHDETYLSTAEAAAKLIRDLPVSQKEKVIVLGDAAYDARVVHEACAERGFTWIFPANSGRVYEGPTAKERPQLRSRLKDWRSLSQSKVRFTPSTGKLAVYRRLSRWRIGSKQKPKVFYTHQEKCRVRSVGDVQLVFSTKKPDLQKATPDDVKILMTNATKMPVKDVVELYSLRWQIELFFRELKSTLGFAQYSFQKFSAVNAWANLALLTVLFLEHERFKRLGDSRLTEETKRWWRLQRLHGLCAAMRQQFEIRELIFLEDRLKTPGGTKKVKRLVKAAIPKEYRTSH